MGREFPVCEFSINPTVPSTSDVVQLIDCSHDPAEVGVAWRAWDFGDGSTSVGPSPSHRYDHPGQYVITLTLATFDGRVGRTTRRVAVRGLTGS
jgi:microbial collagenase